MDSQAPPTLPVDGASETESTLPKDTLGSDQDQNQDQACNATDSRLELLRAKANTLVELPGVYLMKDQRHAIIYVGKAKRLKHRVVSYFRQNKGHNDKVRRMVEQVVDFDTIVCDSEFEALLLECSLIKQYAPKYNILLKDDKGYHYIKITDEPYPRIQEAKQKLADDKNTTYLGPYLGQFSVKQLVDEVNRVFLLPTCHRTFPQDFGKARPCLQFHIKNCDGVCQGKISENAYRKRIEQAIAYLKKGSANAVKEMEEKMNAASERLDFEAAAKWRDKIKATKRVTQKQKIIITSKKSQDFIGVERAGKTACVTLLQFRDGVLTNKQDFTFSDADDAGDLLRQFLLQYYRASDQGGDSIPQVIALPFAPSEVATEPTAEVGDPLSQVGDPPSQEGDPPSQEGGGELALYEEYLTRMAGHTVKVSLPQRGESARLIEMARSNAMDTLSRQVGKSAKEITALQQLGQLLGLQTPPSYIESYDISNFGDDYMVGAMVVFQDAKPKKSAYKKFTMKETRTQDDYAAMREMITRRFRRYLDPAVTDEGFCRLPDLILLDGGKGHVGVIAEALSELGISVPLFGMVKDSKHKTRAIASQGGEIEVSGVASAFRLLTQIQNEVHRFAITFQRSKHKKSTLTLGMTSVSGIGEKKAMLLLAHFKTQQALKAATPEQLQQAGKLSKSVAAALYEYLHS